MAGVRLVQELAFDGARLFCPRHPSQMLMPEPQGSIKVKRVCFAPLEAGGYCWNTAEWHSEEEMRDELGRADV